VAGDERSEVYGVLTDQRIPIGTGAVSPDHPGAQRGAWPIFPPERERGESGGYGTTASARTRRCCFEARLSHK
jgi:hypothetical protein